MLNLDEGFSFCPLSHTLHVHDTILDVDVILIRHWVCTRVQKDSLESFSFTSLLLEQHIGSLPRSLWAPPSILFFLQVWYLA